MDKLIQALDNVQASLDRIYRFLGCPSPSKDPEGFQFWLSTHRESEHPGAVRYASDIPKPPANGKRWGEVYDGGQ